MARVRIVVLICLTVLGCVDSRTRFDEFSERKADQLERDRVMGSTGGGGPSGPCVMPTAEQFAGSYLFALAAKPAPDNPILALLTIEPRMEGGQLVGTVFFEPLAIADGMSTVGVKNEGTFKLSGVELTTPAFHVVLPGDADPVQPGLTAEADIIFSSKVCLGDGDVVEVFCGDAAGNITVPLTLPLEGSTFAAVRIDPDKPWPGGVNDAGMSRAVASCEQVAAQ